MHRAGAGTFSDQILNGCGTLRRDDSIRHQEARDQEAQDPTTV